MARPLRLEYAGALYHVTSRGDRREAIYENDQDRENFLSVFGDACHTHHWVCHAYCLMDNHYHVVVETPEANLSRGMRQLNGVYTQRFNRRHNRVGHVFQGRYKAIHVEQSKAGTRDDAIVMAYGSGGYTQKEIGAYFGLHYARVSRIISMAKSKT